jgi:hypothetical protein
MFRPTPYALRAALLLGSLLFGSASAIAQLKTNPLLPNANLGLPGVQVGVGLRPGASVAVTVPAIGGLTTSPLNTTVNVNTGGASVSATVPSVGGLTPSLGASVNVNTAGPGPALQAGVNVGGSGPGAPPIPETSQLMAAVPQGQVAERRLELLPTCR